MEKELPSNIYFYTEIIIEMYCPNKDVFEYITAIDVVNDKQLLGSLNCVTEVLASVLFVREVGTLLLSSAHTFYVTLVGIRAQFLKNGFRHYHLSARQSSLINMAHE